MFTEVLTQTYFLPQSSRLFSSIRLPVSGSVSQEEAYAHLPKWCPLRDAAPHHANPMCPRPKGTTSPPQSTTFYFFQDFKTVQLCSEFRSESTLNTDVVLESKRRGTH